MRLQPQNRERLQEILREHGHSDWLVVQATPLNPSAPDTGHNKYMLFNFTEGTKAEVVVPNEWFNDPHCYRAIAESVTLAVNTSTAVVAQSGATLRPFLL